MTTIERAFTVDTRLLTPLTEPIEGLAASNKRAVSGLRRILVGLDAVAVAFAWAIALSVPGGLPVEGPFARSAAAGWATVLTIATLLLLGSQRLYLARVCTIRSVEVARLGRAAGAAGIVAMLLPRFAPIDISIGSAVTGAALSFVLLNTVRSGYRHWLQAARRVGRFVRPVVIVGANEEGYGLYRLLANHPELGFRVVGVVGDVADVRRLGHTAPHLAAIDDAIEAVTDAGANGVLVAASAVAPDTLNRLVRQFLALGVHVHLSSGLRGIDHRRVRHQPLAHEPLFYLEPLSLTRWQLAMKRAIDVTLAVVGGLLVALPVVAVAAAAIWLQDRGPVLFRQQRVGRDGKLFTCVKLRTMGVNAEAQYDELAATMAGRDGPLIKLRYDPRITPIGRVLRATSIDELPQLINVLRGDMSLVGPRPAQPAEVQEFDDELQMRHQVKPGISGLWQVEARDNPSFAAYKRYDLFYIENWSVSLDVAILFATTQRVIFRGLAVMAALLRRDEQARLRALALE